MDPLYALNPLDGRYAALTADLTGIFSEAGLMRFRVQAEIEWLIALCEEPAIPEATPLSGAQQQELRGLVNDFSPEHAARIKEIEATTRHDVKAIEYFLQEQLRERKLLSHIGFLHFACTSEDINNIAHALQCRAGLQILRRTQDAITGFLREQAHTYRDVPMLARTHGQSASPVTIGKELAVFADRLARRSRQLDETRLTAKLNGAVGCFNAHVAAYPQVDWPALAQRVIEDRLGLEQNLFTTQIEPHDTLASLFYTLSLWNTILLDLNRDIWIYISMGVFRQKVVAGEVGSSTMPHKVNPIDFENSEGNLGLANSLLTHMAAKLPVSRLQRDLSDSTVLRNTGTAFAYALVAYHSTLRGLQKLSLDETRIRHELEQAWEVLAEPIQTVMRKAGIENPYEQLKELTRGKTVTAETIRAFIEKLDIPADDQQRLLALEPATYTGLAHWIVDQLDGSAAR